MNSGHPPARPAWLPDPPPTRMPWPATLAALVSFAAFFTTRESTLLIPCAAVALVAHHFTTFRLARDSPINWLVRAGTLALVVLSEVARTLPRQDAGIDPRLMDGAGCGCAVVLAVEVWQQRTYNRLRETILLSAFTLLAACNTTDSTLIKWLAPAYFLLIILAMWDFEPRAPARRFHWFSGGLRWLVVAVVLLGSAFTYQAIYSRREAITERFMNLLNGGAPDDNGSWPDPELGSSINLPRSPTRVLLARGLPSGTHLRGLAYDTYRSGRWGPPLTSRSLPIVSRESLQPAVPGSAAHITRLPPGGDLIFAPIDVDGIMLPGRGGGRYGAAFGGPLEPIDQTPNSPDSLEYDLQLTDRPNYQGPLCRAPQQDELTRCLVVPSEIDRRVRKLARSIGRGLSPADQVRAVEAYLPAHHAYSLSFDRGPGDPVSTFLLSRKAAHCQYFAAAAVMLLRCLHVPARYVSGYYAHEGSGPDQIVVRQRDAHAWCEAWVKGVGWVTVDATPGDGRPEDNSVAPWVRSWEALQDGWNALRKWLLGLGSAQKGALVGGLVLVLFLSRHWRNLRRHRKSSALVGYSTRGAALEELAAGFEKLLAAAGAPCPPNIPWREHLRALRASAAEPAPAARPASIASRISLESAEGFVEEYNHARFGPAMSNEDIQSLAGHLANLNSERRGNLPRGRA